MSLGSSKLFDDEFKEVMTIEEHFWPLIPSDIVVDALDK